MAGASEDCLTERNRILWSDGGITLQPEIESVSALDRHVSEVGTLDGVILQGLDLRAKAQVLLDISVDGAVFLGCDLPDGIGASLQGRGAIVFPRMARLPYAPYRPRLYTVDELMKGYVRGEPSSFLEQSRDALIYLHYDRHRKMQPLPLLEALAQRLHDHAIDDALDDLLHGPVERRVVGVMGGHAMARTDDAYLELARLAQGLTRSGYFVATGGGPGAMEAANLGAHLLDASVDELVAAVTTLGEAPGYRDPAWFETAYAVRDSYAGRVGESLAIPTWFYGHEPSNLFSTHVAKYFSNSLREDGLLAIAKHGVIYAPGSAGTIQEVFMDAAQNHYGTFGEISPMVFLNSRFWTEDRPVLPLLHGMAGKRRYRDMIAVLDAADDVVEFIVANPPVRFVQ